MIEEAGTTYELAALFGEQPGLPIDLEGWIHQCPVMRVPQKPQPFSSDSATTAGATNHQNMQETWHEGGEPDSQAQTTVDETANGGLLVVRNTSKQRWDLPQTLEAQG